MRISRILANAINEHKMCGRGAGGRAIGRSWRGGNGGMVARVVYPRRYPHPNGCRVPVFPGGWVDVFYPPDQRMAMGDTHPTPIVTDVWMGG